MQHIPAEMPQVDFDRMLKRLNKRGQKLMDEVSHSMLEIQKLIDYETELVGAPGYPIELLEVTAFLKSISYKINYAKKLAFELERAGNP